MEKIQLEDGPHAFAHGWVGKGHPDLLSIDQHHGCPADINLWQTVRMEMIRRGIDDGLMPDTSISSV
jgi:hypothetical protein